MKAIRFIGWPKRQLAFELSRADDLRSSRRCKCLSFDAVSQELSLVLGAERAMGFVTSAACVTTSDAMVARTYFMAVLSHRRAEEGNQSPGA